MHKPSTAISRPDLSRNDAICIYGIYYTYFMYAERTTLIQVLLPDIEFSTVFCQCCSMYITHTLCVKHSFNLV